MLALYCTFLANPDDQARTILAITLLKSSILFNPIFPDVPFAGSTARSGHFSSFE